MQGDFEIDEVRDRRERCVELGLAERHRQRRLRLDDRRPGLHLLQPVEDLGRVVAQEPRTAWDRTACRRTFAPARSLRRCRPRDEPPRRTRPAARNPGSDGNGLARQHPRPAVPVPELIGGAHRAAHRRRQAELLGQRLRHLGVTVEHAFGVAVPREQELEADAKAMQRRVARAHRQEALDRAAQPEPPVVLLGFYSDVIAEPLGLLVGVGVTADVDEERRVVHGRPRVLVEADPLRQLERDQALAQHMLHRLAEAEIHPQGERGHQLRQAHPLVAHDPSYALLPDARRAGELSSRHGDEEEDLQEEAGLQEESRPQEESRA